MAANKAILVLGAGELGLAVLYFLATHPKHNGATITVALRHGSAKKHSSLIETHGFGVLEANITSASPTELTELFAAGQYDTVIGCTGMTYPAGTQMKIARAVLSARVARYFPWQFGVDYDVIGWGSGQDLFDEQLQVRELLRSQQHTKWCIVSTGMFMSFLFEPVFGVVSHSQGQWRIRGLGGLENKVTVTDVKDIGRVVAELVWVETGIEGVVFTAGETVSYGQLAQIIAKVKRGENVTKDDWTLETLSKELENESANGMRKYRIVFGEGRGVSWGVEAAVNHQWGMKMLGVEEWAREHLRVQ